MYVIDVIPFARSMISGSLSYRSLQKLPEGTIVEVPLRKQKVRGIVISSTPVREAKAALKTASYTLRASSVTKVGALPRALMDAARETATYHAAALSATLGAVVGETLSDELPKTFPKGSGYVRETIEASRKDRIKKYREVIDKNTEAKRATLLVVPTIPEVEILAKIYKTQKPIVLTGNIRGKKREELLATVPIARGLVITTPSFAWTPLQNLGGIIIERVSAGTFLSPKRPYIDMRHALAMLARHREVPLYLGDFPLPVEYRARPEAPLKTSLSGFVEILDTREPEQKETNTWQALPTEVRKKIMETYEADGRSLVLATRRGYAPAVVCRDCGTAVKDARGAVLSLATEKGERVLRSSDGSSKRGANIYCAHCNSWNLIPLGIGVERIEEEIKEFLPSANIVRFDTDTIRTPAAGRKALEQASAPGSVIIATETIFSWLMPDDIFELGLIASADSLLALPFWRARERFVRLGLMLREHAEATVVATRQPEDITLTAITDPAHTEFFEEESSLRKALTYPPYGTLISFAIEGTPAGVEKLRTLIQEVTSTYTLTEIPGRALGNKERVTFVLHLKDGEWPNKELAEQIATLPPSVRVLIDPESLW